MVASTYLLEMFYESAPPALTANSIVGIGPGLDAYGMIPIQFVPSTSLLGLLLQSSTTINLTPTAYDTWYNANSGNIEMSKNATLLTNIYNDSKSDNWETYQQNLLNSSSWQVLEWSTWMSSGQQAAAEVESAFFPDFYSFGGTGGLYALVNPDYNTTPLIDLTAIPWWAYAIVLGGSLILLASTIFGVGGTIAGAVGSVSKNRAAKRADARAEAKEKRDAEKEIRAQEKAESPEEKEFRAAEAEQRSAHAAQMRADARRMNAMIDEGHLEFAEPLGKTNVSGG